MPETRAQLFGRLVEMVGKGRMKSIEPGDGWPSVAEIKVDSGLVPCSVFVGPIGLSHRNRDHLERRFQNPVVSGLPPGEPAGRAIVPRAGTQPLLLGVWEEGKREVLVAAEAQRRTGFTTRYSVFAPLTLLTRAESEGWAEQTNSDGESLVAFWPELLPVFVEAVGAGVKLQPEEMDGLLQASGAEAGGAIGPIERARRAASQLVRRKAFGREVCGAYGHQCALCGFNFSLVVGAHIYPASAPSSPDEVTNGLALCNNHHAAFDAHLIHIDPEARSVKLHPLLVASAAKNEASQSFVDITFNTLRDPLNGLHRPKREMFSQRYDFYPTKYDWAG
jgi:hypothetical protein